ncbi:hypothetical protein BJX66DRAFT_171393 [Aspergillus keveii]|uniref:Uncharacterized protein n=1 Tax=Aspergillus keveii TaxID=714993 RepID=A0ABR4G8D2_9EURO
MPPLSPSSFPLLSRSGVAGNATNATDLGLEVICAWPVSGQYGPGTRVLYYVLITTCVFARKEEWIRNACLAGALLFPAIAALHGIVLAAVHVDGALDMDVYGAFQLCSIGILAVPLTVRMSGTYFSDPRRHIIFLWTGLVLAGLLSITVEFFRVKPSTCTHDDNGTLLTSDISKFPYGTTCDLRCSIGYGPFSPIRVDSTNEIYVVPAPNKLTFGTAMLLAAACCIPAIVSLLYLWSLILQEMWKARFDGNSSDKPIEGTKATVGMMRDINDLVRTVLSTVEVPVFAAAVLAIGILGEKNFFSAPVDYGTERISSIGQWAPIAGAAFAVIGSLYLFLTGDDGANPKAPACKCTCHSSEAGEPICAEGRPSSASTESVASEPQMAIEPQISTPGSVNTQLARSPTPDFGSRRRVSRVLMRLGISLSNAAHDRLHDDQFKQGPALGFPEIPGEQQRNVALPQIREQYNGNIPLSRTGSNLTIASNSNSPRSSRSRYPSPFRTSSPSRSIDARGSSETQNGPGSSSADDPRDRPRRRTNTLEVPVPTHHVPIGRSPSVSSVSSTSFTVPGSQASPTIVVSGDSDIVPTLRDSDMDPAGTASDADSPIPLQCGRRFTS